MPDSAQPTPETDEKKSLGLGSYVLRAFVAAMVYSLTAGPVWMLETHADHFPGFLHFFPRPWVWAYFDTPLHKPLGMYMHFWYPRDFGSDGDQVGRY